MTQKRSDKVIVKMDALCLGVSQEQVAATAFAVRDYCNNLLSDIKEDLEVDSDDLEGIDEEEE